MYSRHSTSKRTKVLDLIPFPVAPLLTNGAVLNRGVHRVAYSRLYTNGCFGSLKRASRAHCWHQCNGTERTRQLTGELYHSKARPLSETVSSALIAETPFKLECGV